MALKVYFDDVYQKLTDEQKDEIIQMLQSYKTQKIQSIDDDDAEKGVNDEYVFDVNDNWISTMFEATTAQKMKKLIDHKCTLLLLVIFSVINTLITFFFVGHAFRDRDHWVHYYAIATWLSWILWFVMRHLSFNRTAFKLCIQSFDYWMKVSHMFIASVSWLIHGTMLNGVCLSGTRLIVTAIAGLLLTSYVSAFDAANASKRMKFILSVFFSLTTLYCAVLSQFYMNDNTDYKIYIKLTHGVHTISMQSLMAHSLRIMCIFFFRQSFRTLFSSKDRAVSIRNSPKITWIDSATQSNDTTNESVKGPTTMSPDSEPQELQLSTLENYDSDASEAQDTSSSATIEIVTAVL